MTAGPMAVGEDIVQPQWLWTTQGWHLGWTGWSEEAVPDEIGCVDGGIYTCEVEEGWKHDEVLEMSVENTAESFMVGDIMDFANNR